MLGNPNKTGYSPQTALSQKLKAMGISSVDQLQGTTKKIFDTIPGTGVANSTYEFFIQNRQLPDTNWNQRFGVGESMIVQEIRILKGFRASGPNAPVITYYNQGGVGVNNIQGDGYFTLQIGNTKVLENYPLAGGWFSNNQSATAGDVGMWKTQLNSLLVIPPDTDLKMNVFYIDSLAADTDVLQVQLLGVGVELNTKF